MSYTTLDSKFSIEADGPAQIVNSVTRVPIPDGEPLFLLRARDSLALRVLRYYLALTIGEHCLPSHIEGVRNQIRAFERYAETHPLKQPGITGDVRNGA